MYNKGKSSSIAKSATNISYNSGKTVNSSGAKVSYSAGQKSGTNRNGDPKGAPVMGKGK